MILKTETAVFNDDAIKEIDERSEVTEQHFWTKNITSPDPDCPNGAYVTEAEQADFDPDQGGTVSGGNLLLQSNKIRLRMAEVTLAELVGTGLKVYEEDDSTNPVAQFLKTGSVLGKETGIHSVSSASGTEYLDGSNTIGRVDYYTESYRPNMRVLASSTPDGNGGFNDSAYVWLEGANTGSLNSYDDASLVADNGDGKASLDAIAWSGFNTSDFYVEMKAEKNVSVLVHPESALRVYIDSNNDPRITYNGYAPFTTYTATATDTVNSNTGKTISCSGTIPTGYTPIGVVQVITNQELVTSINGFVLTSGGGVNVTVRNFSSTNRSTKVTATVLCTSLQ